MSPTPPVYTIEFDFTSADQLAILTTLQEQGYSLLAFRSFDSWEGDVQQMPIWFLASFKDIFGVFTLTYAPEYKVYVTQKDMLGAETTHQAGLELNKSFALSDVTPLGTGLVFNQNGVFTADERTPPGNAISLRNNVAPTSRVMITGLAASVEGIYRPFNAFPSFPTTIVTMTPSNNAVIGIAKLNVADGRFSSDSFAAGALVHLSSARSYTYKLRIEADTFAVVGANSVTTTTIDSSVMSQLATGS